VKRRWGDGEMGRWRDFVFAYSNLLFFKPISGIQFSHYFISILLPLSPILPFSPSSVQDCRMP